MDSTSELRAPWLQVRRVLWIVVWGGLVVYSTLTLWIAFIGLVYPYQLDYGEGIVLWFAQQIRHGQTIYKGLEGLPYASSNYPPVAMALASLLMPIFGEGYLGGRLLNFASALLVAVLIYRMVKNGSRSLPRTAWDRPAVLAALFFLGSPYIFHWVALFRVDLIGLAFAFGGVYCLWEWERNAVGGRQKAVGEDPSTQPDQQEAGGIKPKRWLTLRSLPATYRLLPTAVVLFLLALFTKQTLFAGPAAAFIAIWRHSRRLAIVFAAVLASAFAVVYLAMDYATSGGFTFGLITSNATVFLPEQLFRLLEDFGVTFPILVLLALWHLIHRWRAHRIGIVEWYGMIALAALVMAGRTGAWENYFFEAIAILCVMAGMTLGHWKRENYRLALDDALSAIVVPVLLIVQLALVWQDPRIVTDLVARDLPANQELAQVLARTPAPIISEDMGALATGGKPVDYYTFQYSSLARSGKWDQSWELSGLRDRVFPLVILERGTREDVDHYRRFTREFVSSLDHYYQLTRKIGKYELYTSAPLEHSQQCNFGDEIAMVGWSEETPVDKTGALKVTIVWQAKRAMSARFKAFVHLEDASGRVVSQDDHEPRFGIYPTTRWAPQEMVREVYTLKLPSSSERDKYSLKVGWYEVDSGDRLPVQGSSDDSVVLSTTQSAGAH